MSTCNMVVHGLRFFYHTTLKRDQTTFSIPAQRQPSRLPALLSREEIQRLIHRRRARNNCPRWRVTNRYDVRDRRTAE